MGLAGDHRPVTGQACQAPGRAGSGLPALHHRTPDGPPEDCGGIWVFNEQFADMPDLFTVADLNDRLAGLATVLVPGP